MKTSLFKRSPDYEGASDLYDRAGGWVWRLLPYVNK